MNRKIIASGAALLFALGLHGQNVCLSLQDCRDMAVVNDPYIKNSYLDILAAKAQKQEAFAEYFPTIQASGFGFWALKPIVKMDAYDVFGNNPTGKFIQGMFEALAKENGTNPYFSTLKYGGSAGLTLMQPVFAGGRIVKGNELARLGIEAATLKHDIQIRSKNEDVEKAYWEIVALEEKSHTLDHLDSLLNVLDKDVRSGIDAGVVTSADLMLVKMKKNEVKSGRIQLEGGIKLLKMNLFNSIGQNYAFTRQAASGQKPYISDILLTDRLDELNSPDTYYMDEETMAASVTEARLLDMMVNAKKLEKRMTLGEVLPTVGVGASYGYTYTVGGKFNGMVFALVSIPISDWGKASRKQQRLEYQVQKAQNEKDYLNSQLLLQIRQLWLNLNVAWENMLVAKENVLLAERTVADQTSQYKAGLIPLSELLNTQTKLHEASEGYIGSQIEYSKALTEYLGRKQ